MTTETTERWDATWSDTGEHPAVNVTSAAPLDGPIYTAEDAQRLAMQNARLTDQMRRLDAENVRLSAAYEQARTALETLRSELHPLDERRTGWTPGPKAMPRKHWTQVHGVDDLTSEQQRAALVAPALAEVRDGDSEDYLGAKIAAELMAGTDHKPGWPTWLGDLHHADATLAEKVAETRSWADSYTARPVERTVVQPVEEDTSWRQTEAALYAEMVVSAAEEHVASVYDELAPDRIQDGPPEHDRQGQDPDLTPEHQRQGTDPDLTPEHERKADARSRAVLAPLAQPATQVGGQGDTYNETPPRVGGWRVWAASAAIGIVGLAATIGALVVLA